MKKIRDNRSKSKSRPLKKAKSPEKERGNTYRDIINIKKNQKILTKQEEAIKIISLNTISPKNKTRISGISAVMSTYMRKKSAERSSSKLKQRRVGNLLSQRLSQKSLSRSKSNAFGL